MRTRLSVPEPDEVRQISGTKSAYTRREPSLESQTSAPSGPLAMWEPGMKVGRYELVGPIARGGMAEVWVAQQSGPESFQRVVALKRILATADTEPAMISMLLDEARIAASLSHPAIVQIIELGE